jgi:hypothetical protein
MKNLLIYTGPQKKFSDEDLILAKIQIDNSLDLGWKETDFLLVTDFPFEYNGIKSHVLNQAVYYAFDPKANKIPVIAYLIETGLIADDELYWAHDLDAYENFRITESDLGLENFDLGLTHYTYKAEWQCGSIFFKKGSLDIFKLIDQETIRKPHNSRNNEKTLTRLIKEHKIDPKRYKRLNPTYNLMKKYLRTIYPLADKPIRVLHFRPSDYDPALPNPSLDMFMYSKNQLNVPLMSDRLIKIFMLHGIK